MSLYLERKIFNGISCADSVSFRCHVSVMYKDFYLYSYCAYLLVYQIIQPT